MADLAASAVAFILLLALIGGLAILGLPLALLYKLASEGKITIIVESDLDLTEASTAGEIDQLVQEVDQIVSSSKRGIDLLQTVYTDALDAVMEIALNGHSEGPLDRKSVV